jgi:hypothetical protein
MQEAITILEHSEVVLMKKIKAMKDGKPKYAASEKLREIRDAISILKQVDDAMIDSEMTDEQETEFLIEQFKQFPPKANA